MGNPLLATFKYSRRRLLETYDKNAKENNQDYLLTTKPVHSVQSLQGDVVNASTALGYGYVVFRRNQQMIFFEPAIGSSGALSGDPNHRFSEADTNLTKSRSTPGAADMAIEGVGFSLRGAKPVYSAADQAHFAAAALDPALQQALAGMGPLVDPGSHVLPAELSSPAMLEAVLLRLAPYLSISFEWDQAERTEKIGTADQLTGGGGSSFLQANGVPSPRDRFEVPEGYIWMRDGEPASEFVCRMTLTENVVIPVSLVAPPEAATTFNAPTAIHAEFLCRLFGIQIRLPNKN